MPVSEVENALEAVNGDINEAAGVILNQSVRDEDDDEILMLHPWKDRLERMM